MAILSPPISLCYTFHSTYMYVNEPGIMWAPVPVEDSGLAAWYELKTIFYRGVLRIGFCVNMLHACHFLTSLRAVNAAFFPELNTTQRVFLSAQKQVKI